MNHYPHHIGDFNNATRHLTFVERALYRELLDVYYDTQLPLNPDVARVARRVLANTDELRQALQVVLEEFFVLRADGWHNQRCDDEIEAYVQKQEQQSKAGKASAAKRKAGSGSKPRAGGSAGSVAGGDGAGPTGDERPLNGRATNQNQNQNQNHIPPSSEGARADDGEVPTLHGRWMTLFDQEFGVVVDETSLPQRQKFVPLAKAWIAAGVSVGQMRDAVAKARTEAKGGIAYLPSYVDRVLASMSAAQAVLDKVAAADNFSNNDYGTAVRSL